MVKGLVSEQATLEPHSLRDSQPVQLVPEDRRDVIILSPAEYDPRCTVEDRLDPVEVAGWKACQKTVAIVDPGKYEAVSQLNGHLCR